MNYRKGKRLVTETTASSNGEPGPIVGAEFPSRFWAWCFQHLERYTPPTHVPPEWRGFASWYEATHWAEEER